MTKAGFRGRSFKDILDRNGGAGLGFDLLRLGLALFILISHGSSITGHSGTTAWLTDWLSYLGVPVSPAAAVDPVPAVAHAAQQGGLGANGDPAPPRGVTGIGGPIIRAAVPMFFTLSGFLVTGSALRTRGLLRFIGLRGLRILPALFVEVFLSAIVLGAVFTTLPLRAYFSHPDFYSYFLNIVGDIHFFLPGVFEQGADHVVNANLWTIPSELECYLVMSLLIVLGLLRKRMLMTLLFIAATAALVLADVRYDYMAGIQIFPGRTLIFSFAVGVLFFVWRDRIVFHPVVFGVCCIISYYLLTQDHIVFIAPFFLAYVTVFIGLMPLPQFALLKSGDYSYGIYLYGFPVTKSLAVWLGPKTLPFPVMMLLAVTVTSAFAALSWHGVEKHFLKLKRFLSPSSARITAELHPTVASPDAAEPAHPPRT